MKDLVDWAKHNTQNVQKTAQSSQLSTAFKKSRSISSIERLRRNRGLSDTEPRNMIDFEARDNTSNHHGSRGAESSFNEAKSTARSKKTKKRFFERRDSLCDKERSNSAVFAFNRAKSGSLEVNRPQKSRKDDFEKKLPNSIFSLKQQSGGLLNIDNSNEIITQRFKKLRDRLGSIKIQKNGVLSPEPKRDKKRGFFYTKGVKRVPASTRVYPTTKKKSYGTGASNFMEELSRIRNMSKMTKNVIKPSKQDYLGIEGARGVQVLPGSPDFSQKNDFGSNVKISQKFDSMRYSPSIGKPGMPVSTIESPRYDLKVLKITSPRNFDSDEESCFLVSSRRLRAAGGLTERTERLERLNAALSSPETSKNPRNQDPKNRANSIKKSLEKTINNIKGTSSRKNHHQTGLNISQKRAIFKKFKNQKSPKINKIGHNGHLLTLTASNQHQISQLSKKIGFLNSLNSESDSSLIRYTNTNSSTIAITSRPNQEPEGIFDDSYISKKFKEMKKSRNCLKGVRALIKLFRRSQLKKGFTRARFVLERSRRLLRERRMHHILIFNKILGGIFKKKILRLEVEFFRNLMQGVRGEDLRGKYARMCRRCLAKLVVKQKKEVFGIFQDFGRQKRLEEIKRGLIGLSSVLQKSQIRIYFARIQKISILLSVMIWVEFRVLLARKDTLRQSMACLRTHSHRERHSSELRIRGISYLSKIVILCQKRKKLGAFYAFKYSQSKYNILWILLNKKEMIFRADKKLYFQKLRIIAKFSRRFQRGRSGRIEVGGGGGLLVDAQKGDFLGREVEESGKEGLREKKNIRSRIVFREERASPGGKNRQNEVFQVSDDLRKRLGGSKSGRKLKSKKAKFFINEENLTRINPVIQHKDTLKKSKRQLVLTNPPKKESEHPKIIHQKIPKKTLQKSQILLTMKTPSPKQLLISKIDINASRTRSKSSANTTTHSLYKLLKKSTPSSKNVAPSTQRVLIQPKIASNATTRSSGLIFLLCRMEKKMRKISFQRFFRYIRYVRSVNLEPRIEEFLMERLSNSLKRDFSKNSKNGIQSVSGWPGSLEGGSSAQEGLQIDQKSSFLSKNQLEESLRLTHHSRDLGLEDEFSRSLSIIKRTREVNGTPDKAMRKFLEGDFFKESGPPLFIKNTSDGLLGRNRDLVEGLGARLDAPGSEESNLTQKLASILRNEKSEKNEERRIRVEKKGKKGDQTIDLVKVECLNMGIYRLCSILNRKILKAKQQGFIRLLGQGRVRGITGDHTYAILSGGKRANIQ